MAKIHIWRVFNKLSDSTTPIYCYSFINLLPNVVNDRLVDHYRGQAVSFDIVKITEDDIKEVSPWAWTINLDPTQVYMKDLRAIINHNRIWDK